MVPIHLNKLSPSGNAETPFSPDIISDISSCCSRLLTECLSLVTVCTESFFLPLDELTNIFFGEADKILFYFILFFYNQPPLRRNLSKYAKSCTVEQKETSQVFNQEDLISIRIFNFKHKYEWYKQRLNWTVKDWYIVIFNDEFNF
ncbi:hypothetical protein BpHYR1_033005 [Brachionus plicatilis]|uniref:Uncharacterized protein n=1 Tax=Brachionus plicatilis TaxID=10195 RepID=A0A3M7REL2_BRAPC|nr:hypothetical protein BpHYR1_033005 [Brachionus plicatilis]